MRNVADENIEPVDVDRTRLRLGKAYDACGEPRPFVNLPFKKFVDCLNHL